MMEPMKRFLVIVAALMVFVGSSWAGSLTLLGAGRPPAAAPSYVGPGDLSIGSATHWYSCARAYNAAYAVGGTNKACDVVDTATGLVTCTYHIQTNGFILASECNGVGQSCHTACKVVTAYDQVGSANTTSVQAVSQPTLVFNALGTGGPAGACMYFTATGQSSYPGGLVSTVNPNDAQPFSIDAVWKGGGDASEEDPISATSAGIQVYDGGFGYHQLIAGGAAGNNVTQGVFHASQSYFNGSSSVGYIDATSTVTGSPGTSAFGNGATGVQIGAGYYGAYLTGTVCEAGEWAATSWTSGNATTLNANQHSAVYGYNF
jgi:hypothetical protein